MSDLLFPRIPGLAWDVKKVPTFSTGIQRSIAGREVRIGNFQNPIWEFTLTFEYLRNDPSARDENGDTPLEMLEGFFLERQGQFDDFLLNESDLTQRLEDSVYDQQLIGTGDGVTINFQLVRRIRKFYEAVFNPAGQAADVYVAGTLMTPGADYTITNGMVSFTAAPAIGAAINASFIFLHRVRFDTGTSRGGFEGIELNNFMFNLYECSEIQLVTARR
jgi:uncharacterized protein (TIGR02217 family)